MATYKVGNKEQVLTMMNQQDGVASRASANLVFILVQSYATTLEVFLHKQIGKRYLGLNAIIGAAIIMSICVLFEESNTKALCLFWFLYVSVVFCNVFLRRGDSWQHSYYPGFPRFLARHSRFSEYQFKRWVEPIAIELAGFMVAQFNAPFGGYLMVGGVCLAMVNSMTLVVERNRFLDMRDAVIDQQRVAEQFRADQ